MEDALRDLEALMSKAKEMVRVLAILVQALVSAWTALALPSLLSRVANVTFDQALSLTIGRLCETIERETHSTRRGGPEAQA